MKPLKTNIMSRGFDLYNDYGHYKIDRRQLVEKL